MDMQYESWRKRVMKSPSLPYFAAYLIFASLALILMMTGTNDLGTSYYTIFGFYVQKHALGSLLLALAFLAMFVGLHSNLKTTKSKVLLRIVILLWVFSFVLPIQTILKVNQRVRHGTLIERHGGMTPLMSAAYQGDIHEMTALVKNGADVHARNDVNNTALHFAAGATPVQNQMYRGSPEAIQFLIEHGADVNAENNNRITPLMDAVYNNNLDGVMILISKGADVNKISKYNEAALSAAVIRRYRDIAIELLKHGANPNFKDFSGRTPLQIAEGFHEDSLVRELKKHGAKE